MNQFKKVLTQTSWQVVGKVVTSLSTIVILGAVTRNYGSTGTGIYTLALTYLAFFYLAADCGINAHLLSKLHQPKSSEVWRKLLGMRLMLGAGLVGLSLMALPFLPFADLLFQQAVFIGALTIIGSAVFVTTNAWFQSRLQYQYSIIASSVSSIISVGILLLLVQSNASLPQLMFAHLIGWGLCAGIALLVIKKQLFTLSPIFDLSFLTRTFSEAWPIALTLVLNTVYFRVDTFILASYKTFADVGIYNVSYQLFQSALVLPTFIMNAYYPLMLRNLEKDNKLFIQSVRHALALMFSIGLAGTFVTWLLAPFVIMIVTGGSGFDGSIESLRILSLSFPAFFVSSVLMWTLVATKRYKEMTIIYLIGLMVNVVLNSLLIPPLSFIGASWVTGVSEYLIVFLQIAVLFSILKNKS